MLSTLAWSLQGLSSIPALPQTSYVALGKLVSTSNSTSLEVRVILSYLTELGECKLH